MFQLTAFRAARAAERRRQAGWSRLGRLTGLGEMTDDAAWMLVRPAFEKQTPMIAALTSIIFGLAAYLGTGTSWYLAGICFTVVVATGRMLQLRQFIHAPTAHSPAGWAVRMIVGRYVAALCWAVWAFVVPFESELGVTAMLLGLHAGTISSGVIRNHSIPVMASGQIFIISLPIYVACLFSPDIYVQLYSFIILLHMLTALRLTRTLHRQTLRMIGDEQRAQATATDLAHANAVLELINERLEEQAATDPLTGLLNRRAFDLAAEREWRNAVREERSIAVIMIDIDHFKPFNDRYGHRAGDECLRSVANLLRTGLRRPTDLLARYGGEEFIAVLPATDTPGAFEVAARLLERLALEAYPHEASPLGRLSMSIGIASIHGKSGSTLGAVLEHADRALYDAKRSGRNRCAAFDPRNPSLAAAMEAAH